MAAQQPPSLKLRLRQRLKSFIMRSPVLRRPAGAYLASRLERAYAARAETYARKAREARLVYREDAVIADVRKRLAARGAQAKPKDPGELHTFAIVAGHGWHESLFPDLRRLGPVSRFDYAALGYRWEELVSASRAGLRQREELNALILPALKKAHAERPVDWVFSYCSGYEIKADTVRRIQDELGLPVVNMCLDDKQSWTGRWLGDHSGGQDGIAGVFDVSWTSARVACEWYLAEGGRPLYLPEGFDADSFKPVETPKDIPISFIGEAYGFRLDVVADIRRRGLPIQCFGRGWGGPYLAQDELVKVLNRSGVNLGMGGILHSERLVNLKGRDFEIPAAGGGVYLTSYNPDLADHFDIGREILCYRDRDELVALAERCFKHPEEAAEIARRGRERCLKEHRWLHRYERVCRALGVLA